MRKVLIIGASSAIAQATARLFAGAGDRLFLVARNADKLQAVAADLSIRGAAQVETQVLDVNDTAAHLGVIDAAYSRLGDLDTVLIAHGTLPDQNACQVSFELTRQELATNALSIIALLTELANRFEHQGYGTLAVISSVAGDRGRQSNYIYGAAKAMVNTFLQGLRNRLQPAGVQVLTVKPGFVDTPMTADFKKGFLWAQPETVANDIYRAVEKQKDIIYSPFFWRFIMLLIKATPEFIFKRTRL